MVTLRNWKTENGGVVRRRSKKNKKQKIMSRKEMSKKSLAKTKLLELADIDRTAVKDLLKKKFLSQRIESASTDRTAVRPAEKNS